MAISVSAHYLGMYLLSLPVGKAFFNGDRAARAALGGLGTPRVPPPALPQHRALRDGAIPLLLVLLGLKLARIDPRQVSLGTCRPGS